MKIIYFILSFFMFGCASKIYSRSALIDQILRARPGHKNLTNQICDEYRADDCLRPNVVEYDISDPALRKTLTDLKFVCNVAGQRYEICLDKPGLCTYTEQVSKFLFIVTDRKIVLLDYIPIPEKTQFLLDSNTICAAQESAFGQMMFVKK